MTEVDSQPVVEPNLEDFEPLEVPAGSYSVLQHVFGEKGRLNDCNELSAFALLLNKAGEAAGAMTALGPHFHVPIIGPCGEVTLISEAGKGYFFEDLETYVKWARENFN